MEEEKPKLSPILIGAGVVIVLAIVVFMMTRGGSLSGERPANDVSNLLPKPTETTPPPPPGVPMPAMMGGRRGAK